MHKRFLFLVFSCFFCTRISHGDEQIAKNTIPPVSSSMISTCTNPWGEPGHAGIYRIISKSSIPPSTVETYTLCLGPVENRNGIPLQWLRLQCLKANGIHFCIWILTDRYPPVWTKVKQSIVRYLLQEGNNEVLEFRHGVTGEALLPCLGAGDSLFPQRMKSDDSHGFFPETTRYLGNPYRLVNQENRNSDWLPTNIKILDLLPDSMIGVPINTRPKDDTRRYDESDYDTIRLTQEDYNEMILAGMNCFRVDREQAEWIIHRNVFYWGIGGNDLLYPEALYRSNYLGPLLFLDEPAVCTRDFVIRPRLKDEQEFRKTITPLAVFKEFQQYFEQARSQGNPAVFINGLKARSDVLLGDMTFLQQNLYTWDTIESTATYQLQTEKHSSPYAFVYEPPGHVGTRRTLPEMNMSYLCQIPVDSPKNLIDIIYGFLRGAARNTEKEWGTSIYGAVDRTDAFWFLTHAYDLGAQLFFFWNSYQLACVPYQECLALSRNLRAHIENHPDRDLLKLKHATEVAILLPVGYNLGHVHMGRGNLWGLGELNLERKNEHNVKYRTIMGNFFTEIERCIRLGVSFDLLWDLDGIQITEYREIVRIQEDGKVEVQTEGQKVFFDRARIPTRPDGDPPTLSIDFSPMTSKTPQEVTARALLTEGISPIYYTLGADRHGHNNNVIVLWELYGPEEEDYRFLMDRNRIPKIMENGNQTSIEIQFNIEKPGQYRLRAATCDLAGRTAVVWKEFVME